MTLFRTLLVLWLALLVGCAGTSPPRSSAELLSVSRDPAMAGNRYHKVFVMALAADESRRRMVEDAVVRELNAEGVEAYASRAYIDVLDLGDRDALRAAAEKAVRESGADAVLVGKVLHEDRRTEYGPPQVEQTPVPAAPALMGYGSYVGYGYQTIVVPGLLREVREYFLQTSLYDVASEKPVWRAQSVTLNPADLEQAVNDVADMLTRRLQQDGLLGSMPRSRSTGY